MLIQLLHLEPIVRNLFSILKDGSLYIGGQIDRQYDPSLLDDQITISGAGIYISNEGALQMDFNNIQGTRGEKLTDYIAA